MYDCVWQMPQSTCRIRGSFVRVDLSVHHVASVDQTWVAKLGSRYLDLLAELVTLNPTFTEQSLSMSLVILTIEIILF